MSDITALIRASRRLRASAKAPAALPPLIFVTDPTRTPEPERTAARLPRGSGVIFRAFGAPTAVDQGLRLARACRRRGLVLLAGADPGLARRIGASGVHLPERSAFMAGMLKRRRPHWLVTAAAHGARAIRRARLAGADAVLLSPVFESSSPSAGRPLTAVRFAALARNAGLPVYALGGVNARTARRLLGSGASGIAAAEAVAGSL
jgi:thiamine-phosphate pyrophosphorylase